MNTNPPSNENQPLPVRICVGRELERRRLKFRMTAADLVVVGQLSKQTVRNNERGIHNPGLDTLDLHCRQLSTKIEVLLPTAVRRWGKTEV